MNYVRHLNDLSLPGLQPSRFCGFDIYQQEECHEIAADAGLVLDDFYKPKADIVIDANTGTILYGDNIDTIQDSGNMCAHECLCISGPQGRQDQYDTVN